MDQLQEAYDTLWELIGRLPMTRQDRGATEGSLRLLYQKALDNEEAQIEQKIKIAQRLKALSGD